MTEENKFGKMFGPIPILGMIHLTGRDPVKRAIEEIAIFEECGVDGAIVENYCNNAGYVKETLETIAPVSTRVIIGVNILSNLPEDVFPLADKNNASFIQLDQVAGAYTGHYPLDVPAYQRFREQFPNICVLGGVWPKYHTPIKGSNLEVDLAEGVERADAIVVTGRGTGQATPLDRIERFRGIIGDFPLVVGAGLTPENAYNQLMIADGAIVGTCLKVDGVTEKKVDPSRVRKLMDVVRKVRLDRYGHTFP